MPDDVPTTNDVVPDGLTHVTLAALFISSRLETTALTLTPFAGGTNQVYANIVISRIY